MPFPARVPAALALLLAAAPAAAATWTLVHDAPRGSAVAAGVEAFASEAAQASGGALTFEVRAGAAGGERATVVVQPLGALADGDPVLALARVPFLATNFVEAGKLWRVLRPRVEEALARDGRELLYAAPSPPRALLARRPIETLGAFAGRRVLDGSPAVAAFARRVGASPVAAASPRSGFETGLVDLAFVSPADAARDRAWEYAPRYVHAPLGFPMHVVAVERRALQALGAGERAAVLDAARRTGDAAWARARSESEDAVQRLRDYGVKTDEPPVGLLIALEAVGRELLFAWSESAGETGAGLVEAYYAIR